MRYIVRLFEKLKNYIIFKFLKQTVEQIDDNEEKAKFYFELGEFCFEKEDILKKLRKPSPLLGWL